jgi:NTP pyrophosphatase (non-canonical NTP hydrolase)
MEFCEMIEAVRAFHRKYRLRELGGEEMHYRLSLLIEELGELAACLTKGKGIDELAEENADLLILIIGNAISAGVDLEAAFQRKMKRIMARPARMVDGTIRVTEYGAAGGDDPTPA